MTDKEEIAQLEEELDDLRDKLDAAGEEIAMLESEIVNLKSKIEDSQDILKKISELCI